MSSWSGSRSPEFGVYPVELQFSLDSHVGPSWVVPALFNRSGWLSVAEVEMETEFDTTRAVIAACINDEGEVLGQWVVEALFAMQSSLPQEVVVEPPDDLADALDALYWDFLGRCDIAHLKTLEEEERRISAAIARLELRRKDVYEKVEIFLSSLYARRRRERGNDELCRMIDLKIEEVEAKQAETEIWHKGRLRDLQSELATFESQVLESLQNHGHLRPLYTIYWQTRHSKVRTLANAGFEMRFGLPAPPSHELDMSAIEAETTAWRQTRLDKKRREFEDYYAALDEKAHADVSQREAVRKIMESLKTPKSPAKKPMVALMALLSDVELPPIHARPGTQADIAEMSRRWQLMHGSVNGVTIGSVAPQKVTRVQPTDPQKEKGVEETSDPDRGLVTLQTEGSEPPPIIEDDTIELRTIRSNRHLSADDLLAVELQRALDDDAELEPPEIARAADETVDLQVLLSPTEPVALTEPLSRPERNTRTLRLPAEKAAPEAPDTLPSVDMPTAIFEGDRRTVAEGDTVLLRFTDGGIGRFIRFTIRGFENDPSKGVIATSDPRAASLIGKGVGDAVELKLPTIHRQVVIEKLWREEDRQPLAPVKPKAVWVTDIANQRVEPGDLLLLEYRKNGKRQSRYYRVPTDLERALLPSQATSETPVDNLLGKRVGDAFVMRVASAERRVTIHRIMKP